MPLNFLNPRGRDRSDTAARRAGFTLAGNGNAPEGEIATRLGEAIEPDVALLVFAMESIFAKEVETIASRRRRRTA